MPVIAMTREMGTRGKDVALGVANRLGLDVVHHEIVEKSVAERLRMSESSVHRFLEGQASLWERWQVDHQRLSRYTAVEILELAARGNVVIRGWGAAQLLAPVAHVVRVHVCASMQDRVAEMTRRLDLDDEEVARAEIVRSDKAHDRIIRSRFNSDWQDSTGYALTLNTGALPIETCVNYVCALADNAACTETSESHAKLDNILIAERVRAAIDDDTEFGTVAGDVTIKSDRGHVTLKCMVTSGTDIEGLVERVKEVPGVKSVQNDIRTMPLVYGTYGP